MMNFDRVGILTDEVSANFDEALDWVSRQGLKHVEGRVIDGKNVSTLNDEQVQDAPRRIEQRGLYVSGISSPVFKCALNPARPVASGDTFGQAEESVEAHFAKLDRVIAIARLLATRRIRIFSFWREVEPLKHTAEIVRQLQRAARVAEGGDVQLLVENEP